MCEYCEKYVETCSICGRTVTENGDGFNYSVSDEQLKKLDELNIEYTARKGGENLYTFWLCASFEEWKTRYCFEKHLLNHKGDPVDKIISLHEKGIQTQRLLDDLESAVMDGIVLDKQGNQVEPDHPDSPIRHLI